MGDAASSRCTIVALPTPLGPDNTTILKLGSAAKSAGWLTSFADRNKRGAEFGGDTSLFAESLTGLRFELQSGGNDFRPHSRWPVADGPLSYTPEVEKSVRFIATAEAIRE